MHFYIAESKVHNKFDVLATQPFQRYSESPKILKVAQVTQVTFPFDLVFCIILSVRQLDTKLEVCNFSHCREIEGILKCKSKM